MANQNEAELIEAVETATEHIRRGNGYYESGKFKEAVAEYNKAVELEADVAPHFGGGNPYAVVYNNRGAANSEIGCHGHDKAIGDLNKAIDLSPDDAESYYNRGAAYNDLEQYDKAISDYSKAIDLEPERAIYYINRGRAYNLIDNNGRAIDDFDRAVEINPDSSEAYLSRATVYLELRELDRAVEDINKALALNPRGPGAKTVHYLVRAEARFKQRKLYKAFADLWNALARLPLSLFQRESDEDAVLGSGSARH
ncbi:MAG: tetratricopeptide repeat protein [Candidatus Poribacteria bacterium]|nr:tetratricopeptide repeat protein [Candidatus Poribacteria bacterium]